MPGRSSRENEDWVKEDYVSTRRDKMLGDLSHQCSDGFNDCSLGQTTVQSSSSRVNRLGLWLTIVVLVVVGSGICGFLMLREERLVIELTQQQIQEKLDERFPMDKLYLQLLSLTLSDPKVELAEGSDRITFGLNAVVNIRIHDQSKPLSGRVIVTTGLRYEPSECFFYLDEPVVDKVEIEGLPIKHVDLVNRLARMIAQDRINRTRVYKLDKPNMKQAITRAVLQGLVVKDGKMIITLGVKK